MYGGIAEPGMGAYSSRVRRERWVSPRGNSRRTLLAPSLAQGGRGGSPRPMGFGLGKRWDESHLPIELYFFVRLPYMCRITPVRFFLWLPVVARLPAVLHPPFITYDSAFHLFVRTPFGGIACGRSSGKPAVQVPPEWRRRSPKYYILGKLLRNNSRLIQQKKR